MSPPLDVTPGSGESLWTRQLSQVEDPAGGESATGEHGVAKFTESGIEGEDGFRCLAHGV
jgi:hypothetical protein